MLNGVAVCAYLLRERNIEFNYYFFAFQKDFQGIILKMLNKRLGLNKFRIM